MITVSTPLVFMKYKSPADSCEVSNLYEHENDFKQKGAAVRKQLLSVAKDGAKWSAKSDNRPGLFIRPHEKVAHPASLQKGR
eukprot:1137225-Pelagomonas_calceolata.AAC.12